MVAPWAHSGAAIAQSIRGPLVTMKPTIATWFVADSAEEATFFPQVSSRSDSATAQAVYWRCTVCFFASSLALNPQARHVLYTNGPVPAVDGHDVAAMLERWGVEVIRWPVSMRLHRGAVESWGNQFYVFDVIEHHIADPSAGPLILLDSDCLWLRPVSPMLAAIDRHQALTYLFNAGEYAEGAPINGQTRAGLARFLAQTGGPALARVEYCGGELIAASAPFLRRLHDRFVQLWPAVLEQSEDAPREEAHLLSILYAAEGIALGTANHFIRRMWTTFKHNNLQPTDTDLTIWHLPAEKRTGFADLFGQIVAAGDAFDPATAPRGLISPGNYGRLMGVPRRRPGKFVRDLALKITERLG